MKQLLVFIFVVVFDIGYSQINSMQNNSHNDKNPAINDCAICRIEWMPWLSSINLGYESAVYPYSNKVFLGQRSAFGPMDKFYKFTRDNYLALNPASVRFNYNNTTAFQVSSFALAFSSDIYLRNWVIFYKPGIGINYDLPLLTCGVYYYFHFTNNSNVTRVSKFVEDYSKVGIRLTLRPGYLIGKDTNDY